MPYTLAMRITVLANGSYCPLSALYMVVGASPDICDSWRTESPLLNLSARRHRAIRRANAKSTFLLIVLSLFDVPIAKVPYTLNGCNEHGCCVPRPNVWL